DAFEPLYEQLYGSALLIQEAWNDVVTALDELLFPFRIFLSELGFLDGIGDSIFSALGKAIKVVVSYALTPMAYFLRFIVGLVTGAARIFLTFGEIVFKALAFVAK